MRRVSVALALIATVAVGAAVASLRSRDYDLDPRAWPDQIVLTLQHKIAQTITIIDHFDREYFGRRVPFATTAVPVGPVIFPQLGHTSVVLSVTFSRDGRTLASGSLDQTIKLWDVASGRE